jgi:hypothetical protein
MAVNGIKQTFGQYGFEQNFGSNLVVPATYIIYYNPDNQLYYAEPSRERDDLQMITGADAATVIQSAINALTSGGKIFIKNGLYSLTSTLLISSGITLQGESKYGTILKKISSGVSPIIQNSGRGRTPQTNENIIIKDLTLDGAGPSIHTSGIMFTDVNNVLIENVYFKDIYWDGIQCNYESDVPTRQAENWRIINCDFYNVGINNADGIALHAAKDVKVLGCRLTYSGGRAMTVVRHGGAGIISENVVIDNIYVDNVTVWDGIYTNNIKDVTISNFIVKNCNQNGIAISYSAVRNERIKITDGTIYNCVKEGLVCVNVDDLTITDVTSYGHTDSTYGKGICIQGSNNVKISDCYTYNCASSGMDITSNSATTSNVLIENSHSFNNAGRGIRLRQATYATSNVHVLNCDIQNNTSYGLEVNTITGYLVSLNRLVSNTAGNLYVTGGSGTIHHNVGYVTENGGTATFSGNGSTKTFTIAHGLASTPTKVLVTAGSDAAKGDFYVTADATNITVTYATAPPTGTNNVILNWYAEV